MFKIKKAKGHLSDYQTSDDSESLFCPILGIEIEVYNEMHCNCPLEIEVHPGAAKAEVNVKVDVDYELMINAIEKIQSGIALDDKEKEAVVRVLNVSQRDIEGEIDLFDKNTERGSDTGRKIGIWYSKAIEGTDVKEGIEGIFGEWVPFKIGSEVFVVYNSFLNGSRIGKDVIKAIHINQNGLFMRVKNALETTYYPYTDIGKVLFINYVDAVEALNGRL